MTKLVVSYGSLQNANYFISKCSDFRIPHSFVNWAAVIIILPCIAAWVHRWPSDVAWRGNLRTEGRVPAPPQCRVLGMRDGSSAHRKRLSAVGPTTMPASSDGGGSRGGRRRVGALPRSARKAVATCPWVSVPVGLSLWYLPWYFVPGSGMAPPPTGWPTGDAATCRLRRWRRATRLASCDTAVSQDIY